MQAGEALEKVFGFNKANVYNWIKTVQNVKSDYQILKLNELYWFIDEKVKTETRESAHVMTMVSRTPYRTVNFDAAFDKAPVHTRRCLMITRKQSIIAYTVIGNMLILFIQVNIFATLII